MTMTETTFDERTAEFCAEKLLETAAKTRAGIVFSMQGHNPPATAQIIAMSLEVLPHETSENLGSREFKNAVRALFAAAGIPISLTRSDIVHGARFLHVNGLLPSWVRTEGIGGTRELAK
jgi:hypothetical protein